jgi:BMFP domain-containing protein YqiC
MQTDNRLFDDLARVANGAINTLSGVREEIESRLRERVERWLTEMDMVPREEFEAIRDLAQKARAEQEDLTVKVAALEAKLAAMNGGPEKTRKTRKAATRPATKSAAKPAAKPATRRRTAEAKGAD